MYETHLPVWELNPLCTVNMCEIGNSKDEFEKTISQVNGNDVMLRLPLSRQCHEVIY